VLEVGTLLGWYPMESPMQPPALVASHVPVYEPVRRCALIPRTRQRRLYFGGITI
jgi:hypothetical protein